MDNLLVLETFLYFIFAVWWELSGLTVYKRYNFCYINNILK